MESLKTFNTRFNGLIGDLYSKLFPSERDIIRRTALTEYELDRFYDDNFVAQNVVNVIPEDCTLTEPIWKIDTGNNQEVDLEAFKDNLRQIVTLGKPMEEIDLRGGLMLAWKYARLYGDGFVFLGIDDGQDPSEPVNVDKIKGIKWALVADRYHVYMNYLSNQVTYYPEGYRYHQSELVEANRNRVFHLSRVLRFSGIESFSSNNLNGFFNLSVIGNVFNSYKNYVNSLRYGADMLASHSVFKYGMKGLDRITQVGKQNEVKKRFENLMDGLTIFGGLVYDVNSEEADFINRNYSGVKDILEHLQNWLIASSGTPRGKIFNNAPANSMSEGSEGERYIWNEIVKRNQHLKLSFPLKKLAKYVLAGMGYQDTRIEIDYPPHYPLTQKEIADIRYTNAQTDKIYFDMGTLAKEEVRMSRWGGTNTYGFDIVLIDGALAKEEAIAEKKMAEQQKLMAPKQEAEKGQEEEEPEAA